MTLYDPWWYGGTVGVATDVAVLGAGQLAQAGGPLVTRPGEVVPEMAAYLYHRPQINSVVAMFDNAAGHTFQDRLKEIGTGSVDLYNDDPDLAHVWDHECAVRFEILGRAAFTMLVNEIQHVAIAEGEEHDQLTTLGGRAHISILEEAVVYPAIGVDKKPFDDNRLFSWPAVDYDDRFWQMSHGITRFSTPDSYWSKANIENWPDGNAEWMWAPGSNEDWAPAGPCYFRNTVVVPDGATQLVCYAAFDDVGQVYVDGQQIIEGEFGMNPMITGNPNDAMDTYEMTIDISPGNHVVAIRNDNGVDPEWDFTMNPGAVLFTCYATSGADAEQVGPLLRSDSTWKCLPYPPHEPGMTPGEVIRHVITEAQNRGAIPEVRLAFTDKFDSDGNAWPITPSISTKIGTNYWVFIGEEMATTYADVWMGPGDFTLFAWVHDKRGRERDVTLHGPTDEADESTANLRGLSHHLVR